VLWTLCGAGTAYNVSANAAYVAALPNSCRSQGIAIASAGMVTGQGLAALLAGVTASVIAPWYVVSAAGGIAVVVVATMALMPMLGGVGHALEHAVPERP
jgi:hypothetical protein